MVPLAQPSESAFQPIKTISLATLPIRGALAYRWYCGAPRPFPETRSQMDEPSLGRERFPFSPVFWHKSRSSRVRSAGTGTDFKGAKKYVTRHSSSFYFASSSAREASSLPFFGISKTFGFCSDSSHRIAGTARPRLRR